MIDGHLSRKNSDLENTSDEKQERILNIAPDPKTMINSQSIKKTTRAINSR